VSRPFQEKLTTAQFVHILRKLAALYEQKPTLPVVYALGHMGDAIYCHSKEEFATTVKAFGGGEKDATDQTIEFYPVAFPTLKIVAFKNQVCERVVVGKRIIPALPAFTLPATKEHEEEIVEWRCSPFTQETVATAQELVVA
jgi:hypothetical protein